MSLANCTTFPIKGQAFKCAFVVKSLLTGSPLTGGLATLASTVSKDGGNFAATTTAPTEIQTSGMGYIALSATEMNADLVVIQVTSSSTNAITHTIEIRPMVTAESAGQWLDQSTVRFEQGIVHMSAFLMNYHTLSSATETVYGRDSSTALFSGSLSGVASASSTQSRAKLA